MGGNGFYPKAEYRSNLTRHASPPRGNLWPGVPVERKRARQPRRPMLERPLFPENPLPRPQVEARNLIPSWPRDWPTEFLPNPLATIPGPRSYIYIYVYIYIYLNPLASHQPAISQQPASSQQPAINQPASQPSQPSQPSPTQPTQPNPAHQPPCTVDPGGGSVSKRELLIKRNDEKSGGCHVGALGLKNIKFYCCKRTELKHCKNAYKIVKRDRKK